jgi:hypothetical protein
MKPILRDHPFAKPANLLSHPPVLGAAKSRHPAQKRIVLLNADAGETVCGYWPAPVFDKASWRP